MLDDCRVDHIDLLISGRRSHAIMSKQPPQSIATKFSIVTMSCNNHFSHISICLIYDRFIIDELVKFLVTRQLVRVSTSLLSNLYYVYGSKRRNQSGIQVASGLSIRGYKYADLPPVLLTMDSGGPCSSAPCSASALFFWFETPMCSGLLVPCPGHHAVKQTPPSTIPF